MKILPFDFKMLALGMTLCLGLFISSGNSLAQVASPTTPAFKFKLEAFDAQTNGAITSATTQINFALLVTNETTNTYTNTKITTSTNGVENISVLNYPPVAKVDEISGPFYNGGPIVIYPFSTRVFYFQNKSYTPYQPLVLKNTSTMASIVATANFAIQYLDPSNNQTYTIQSYVDDFIYNPSNTDLIPSVVNNQTTASSILSTIESTENEILKAVTPVPPVCKPTVCKAIYQCGSTVGVDNCGNTCQATPGTCPSSEVCNSNNQCVVPPSYSCTGTLPANSNLCPMVLPLTKNTPISLAPGCLGPGMGSFCIATCNSGYQIQTGANGTPTCVKVGSTNGGSTSNVKG